MAKIESTASLRDLYALPGDRAMRKVLSHLDPHCVTFIGKSPFLMLATRGEDQLMDVSPRGDAPGFVHVHNDKTLLIPDRPGNNRLDSLQNIVSNPAVGLIFLVPSVDETLRINGVAEIRDDPELTGMFEVKGKTPKTVISVTVREAYLHCAKALMRSSLWQPDSWGERSDLPTMGQMLKDQINLAEAPETQEDMIKRYRDALY